jgi:sialate O-acetylesterase
MYVSIILLDHLQKAFFKICTNTAGLTMLAALRLCFLLYFCSYFLYYSCEALLLSKMRIAELSITHLINHIMNYKCLFIGLLLSFSSFANLTIPSFFSSGMVLQQKSKVKIWGSGKTSEPVVYKTTVDVYGKWSLELDTPMFGGPYEIKIKGNNEILLKDVWIGEVWLVSGQSNMEWSARSGIDNAEAEIQKANFPEIRLFSVNHATAETPQQNLSGDWKVCTPASMRDFSAIGYYFAKHLFENIQVPVGIINTSWGGTPAEAWVPKESIYADATLLKDALGLKEVPWGPVKTAAIYNAMVAPLAGLRIKGFLWYQGESNVSNAANYDKLLTALIQSWRNAWGDELPFYYVQIAPYKYGNPEEGVVLRNAQRMAENTSKTAMVAISDIGNIDDIHPRNKKDVGIRLANVALKNLYSAFKGEISGPKLLLYESKKGQITLFFNTQDLKCDKSCMNNFEIADISGEFRKASVRVKSNTIVLTNSKISYPVFARFEWNNTAEASLKNNQGLPASAFITDNWWQFKNY